MSWGNYFETGSGSLWPCIGLLKSAMLQSQASTLLCLLTSPLITSSQSDRLRPEAQPLVPSKDPLKNIGLFIDTSQWVWCWSPALNLWQATITNHELLNYGSCWSVRCIRVRLPAKVGPKKGFFFLSEWFGKFRNKKSKCHEGIVRLFPSLPTTSRFIQRQYMVYYFMT